jgi:hypothetical protein
VAVAQARYLSATSSPYLVVLGSERELDALGCPARPRCDRPPPADDEVNNERLPVLPRDVICPDDAQNLRLLALGQLVLASTANWSSTIDDFFPRVKSKPVLVVCTPSQAGGADGPAAVAGIDRA